MQISPEELDPEQLPPLLNQPEEDESPSGMLSSLLPQKPLALATDEPEPEQEATEGAERTEAAIYTSLKLDDKKKERLVRYAQERIDEVMREMGLDSTYRVVPDSWMDLRRRHQNSYDGDLSWRVLMGGIFEKSNFSLGTSTRHARYISARVQDDLLGTSPFFAAISKKADKVELARQAEEYLQEVVERSTVRSGIREAQKQALIQNEAVVKTSWVKDATPFWGPATVAVTPDNKPIITEAKRLYIFENDNFLPAPDVEANPDGSPVLVVLEKDPSFSVRPGDLKYQLFDNLEQTRIAYEGPKAEPLDFRCFLCPLAVRSIHEADINVHIYQETPARLKEIYGKVDLGQTYFNSQPTGDQQAKTVQGERDDTRSSVFQQITVGEVYVRFDADGDGVAEEIFMVLDLDKSRNEQAIFFDYLSNHFAKRPFEVIPGIEKVPGRWYGRGIFRLNFDRELHQDAEFNRANVRGSRQSSVLFRRRGACEEWDGGLRVQLGGDQVLTCNEGYDPEKNPPIFRVNLAEQNDQSIELMELSRSAMDSLVGAVSPQDASQSDLNQSKTATGIVSIQATGDVILKATEQDQLDPITKVLEQVIDVSLEHMDPTVLQLNKEATELLTLNRDEIRSLSKDVRLTLTKSRSTQLQATSERALAIVKDYRATMLQDPQGAKIMRQFYIDQLKAFEVNNADEVCPEITDQMIQAAQQQPAQQQPPSKSISAKLTDLALSERAQVLQSEGITPASPQELAQMKAEQQASDAAAAALKKPPINEQSPQAAKPGQPDRAR